MVISRYGWCATCHAYITVKKDFVVTVDMFNPENSGITKPIKEQIIAWREEDIYCDVHQPIAISTINAYT